MRYTYYPGVSPHAPGVAYDKSIRAVFDRLGAELVELDDWNCCGATAYMSVRKTVAYAISARNLALAAKVGDDVVAPCSACYYVLNRTREALGEQPELRANVGAALAEAGLELGLATPRTPPIAGSPPACYYGCQMVRPSPALDEDPELPMAMERLFIALGATPVDYPPKGRCCGGRAVATSPEVARQLSEALLGWARARGANCMATVSPLSSSSLSWRAT